MKKALFSLLIFGILFEPVYAISADVKLYTNIVAVGLVFIGLIIIVFSKIFGNEKEVYIEKEKNRISGLTDKEKISEIKEFNSDSIFKTLPTFSIKKYEEDTKKEITNKLKNNDNSFNITDFKIIDFKEEENKYIIKSWASIETGTKKNKEKNFYTITSTNTKIINKDARCPQCGGKIKDITRLRCKHCGSILPNNNNINNDEWITENIEKTN